MPQLLSEAVVFCYGFVINYSIEIYVTIIIREYEILAKIRKEC